MLGCYFQFSSHTDNGRRGLPRSPLRFTSARNHSRSIGVHPRRHAFVFAILALVTPSLMAQEPSPQIVKKTWRVVESRPGQRLASSALPAASANLPAINLAQYESNAAGEILAEQPPMTTGIYDPGYSECCDSDSCDSQIGAISSLSGPWLSVDYLNWTAPTGELPPLVRSTPNTLPANTGVLGQPGQTLLGGNSDDFNTSGYRLGGGWWFDDCRSTGAEVVYMGMPETTLSNRFDSLSFPFLGRPVFDTGLNAEAAMLVAHPNFLIGSVTAVQSSEFHHIEALRRDLQFQNRCRRIDSLIGLRYASLENGFLIEQSSEFTVAQGQIIAGTRLDLFDRFESRNQFQGIVLGLDITERMGMINLHARGTLGIGNNRAEVTIDGQTRTSVPNAGEAVFAGGLLAQTTNIGTYKRNRFSVMPEGYLGLGVRFNTCWELKAGYQVIYWSEAALAGDQIDRRVSQFPPEPPAGIGAPGVLLKTDGILIHGLQTGLTCTF